MDVPPLILRSHHELFSAVAAGDIDTVRCLFPIPTANESPAAAASATEVGGGDDPRTASIDGGGDHLSFLRVQNNAGLTVIHVAAQNNMEEILRHFLSFCATSPPSDPKMAGGPPFNSPHARAISSAAKRGKQP